MALLQIITINYLANKDNQCFTQNCNYFVYLIISTLFKRYCLSDSLNFIKDTSMSRFTIRDFQILALMFENVCVPDEIRNMFLLLVL